MIGTRDGGRGPGHARRLIGALTATVVLLAGAAPSALADSSPSGALQAAFQSYFSGGNGVAYGTFGHGGAGYFHAANRAIDFGDGAVRIVPVWDGTYCAGDTFGIWVFLLDPDKDLVEQTTFDMSLGTSGGPLEPLASQATAVRRAALSEVFVGDTIWWRSVGVPVYGQLGEGEYVLHVESNVFGDWDTSITIEPC